MVSQHGNKLKLLTIIITVCRWVIYDEVHALSSDSPDGKALQRLVKMLKCKFLALSATVGNAEELRRWMDQVHINTHNHLLTNKYRSYRVVVVIVLILVAILILLDSIAHISNSF